MVVLLRPPWTWFTYHGMTPPSQISYDNTPWFSIASRRIFVVPPTHGRPSQPARHWPKFQYPWLGLGSPTIVSPTISASLVVPQASVALLWSLSDPPSHRQCSLWTPTPSHLWDPPNLPCFSLTTFQRKTLPALRNLVFSFWKHWTSPTHNHFNSNLTSQPNSLTPPTPPTITYHVYTSWSL